MARSFAFVAFLVFALCLSSALARKEAPVDTPAKARKAPQVASPVKAPHVVSPGKGRKAPQVASPVKVPKAAAPVKAPKAPKVASPVKAPKAPKIFSLVKNVTSPVKARKAARIEPFTVIGKIYCDPCRFQFVSRLSKPLEGVKVSLTCRKEEGNNVTYVKEGKTDGHGVYKILVDGDHEDEICEVTTEATKKGSCTDLMVNKSDRIVLTNNMGSSSLVRLVNPLGFMTKSVDSQCRLVVKELGLDKLEA